MKYNKLLCSGRMNIIKCIWKGGLIIPDGHALL